MKVLKPELPAVEQLDATKQGENTMLMWSEPELSGTPVQVVTDDFEDCIPFDINRAGRWTFYDVVGLPTTTNYYFPGRNEPMAFIVMNLGMVQRLEGTLADTWPAHSGESEPSNSVSISDSGIEELSMDDLQNAPIYDLQGRRVLNPERGQIYVTKGKKFLYR